MKPEGHLSVGGRYFAVDGADSEIVRLEFDDVIDVTHTDTAQF